MGWNHRRDAICTLLLPPWSLSQLWSSYPLLLLKKSFSWPPRNVFLLLKKCMGRWWPDSVLVSSPTSARFRHKHKLGAAQSAEAAKKIQNFWWKVFTILCVLNTYTHMHMHTMGERERERGILLYPLRDYCSLLTGWEFAITLDLCTGFFNPLHFGTHLHCSAELETILKVLVNSNLHWTLS